MALRYPPYVPVPAPVITPTRFGLYAVATPIERDHGQWQDGFQWDDSDNCTQGGLWQMCCNKFAEVPPLVTRPVSITVVVTAELQPGGTIALTAVATDNWTGPPIGPFDIAVGGDTYQLSTDGVPVPVGELDECITAPADGQSVPVNIEVPGAAMYQGTLEVGNSADPYYPCGGRLVYHVTVDLAEPTAEKTFTDSSFVYGDPFVVYDGRVCPTFTEEQAKASARNRLLKSEQRQVEQMFWKGPNQARLADPTVTVVHNPATPVTPAMGVALLEACLADSYLGEGIIHAPRYTAGLFNQQMQISDQLSRGGVLRTPLGTAWSFGAGYPRTGPDGTEPPAGQSWVYATGQVVIYRSPIVENATRDITGCMTGLAERTVGIAIQCDVRCAALIDFSRCDCEPQPETP